MQLAVKEGTIQEPQPAIPSPEATLPHPSSERRSVTPMHSPLHARGSASLKPPAGASPCTLREGAARRSYKNQTPKEWAKGLRASRHSSTRPRKSSR